MVVDVPRLAIACLASLLISTSVAYAQPAAPDTARANALGHEALEAFRKNDWARAHARFADAEAAAHSPVFVLYMARSKRNAGDLLGARDLLARAAGEVLPDSATAPWKSARADAGKELNELEGRIPSILVALRAPAGVTAAVMVDGAPIDIAMLRAPIRLNPGHHAVKATPPGGATVTVEVHILEGDPPRNVEIEIPPDPPKITPPIAAPPALVPLASPVVVPPPARGSLAPGLIGMGLGAAGLLTGAILGGVAKSTANTAIVPCDKIAGGGLDCPVSAKPEIERAQGLATGANVALIAGGVVAAAGVVLVIVRPGGGKQASAAIVPGLGTIAIRGSF